jgi:hypothetical protein
MEFTEEMLKRVVVPGKGMPIYLDQRPPELEDPARQLAEHHWQPACTASSRLTRCLEAVRDVSTALSLLNGSPKPADKRIVKQVISPIYNLAIAIRDLFNYVQSKHWTELGKQKQTKLAKRFKQFGEAVPTARGTLKTARDKITAHIDKAVSTTEYRQFWDLFGIADVPAWIKGCLRMLQLLIHPDIYRWTRLSPYSNVVVLMTSDGTEISILLNGEKPKALVGLNFVVSPKDGIIREIRELMGSCMVLEQRLRIRPDASEESAD